MPAAPPIEQWPLSRLLITAGRLVERDIARELRPYHLSHASLSVLSLVQGQPLSQRALAQATRVEEQTVSQTVDRLERMGLVTREKDPADRRRFMITVSAAGAAVLRRAAGKDHAEQALRDLPEAEHLRSSLLTLLRRFDAEDLVAAAEPQA
ncbi:MAG: MarR family transcriptional regulator [Candidatus Nanopelagicales bacterium]